MSGKQTIVHSNHEILFSSKKQIIDTYNNLDKFPENMPSYKGQFQGLLQYNSIYIDSWNDKFIAVENPGFRRMWDKKKMGVATRTTWGIFVLMEISCILTISMSYYGGDATPNFCTIAIRSNWVKAIWDLSILFFTILCKSIITSKLKV